MARRRDDAGTRLHGTRADPRVSAAVLVAGDAEHRPKAEALQYRRFFKFNENTQHYIISCRDGACTCTRDEMGVFMQHFSTSSPLRLSLHHFFVSCGMSVISRSIEYSFSFWISSDHRSS